MRTKTLLLTAALSAAGIATSMAQVFSVNAVGYVNTTVGPGYSIVSNPLTAANNTIAELFKGVPGGTQVYKYKSTGFVIATYDVDEGGFVPAEAGAETVLPGEGVFIRNPGTTPLTITFVGEVPQGDLKNPLPQGLSIKASMVPQAGTAKDLGLVGSGGDQVYQFVNATGGYYISTYDVDEGDWTPVLKPLAVGEGFFLRKVAAASWDRTFSVNQ